MIGPLQVPWSGSASTISIHDVESGEKKGGKKKGGKAKGKKKG